MQKGIFIFQVNKEVDAQDVFLDCMESDDGSFDPRILRECILRLMKIQKKKGTAAMHNKLESLLDKFAKKNKDYIFLVN